jgi:Icc protein
MMLSKREMLFRSVSVFIALKIHSGHIRYLRASRFIPEILKRIFRVKFQLRREFFRRRTSLDERRKISMQDKLTDEKMDRRDLLKCMTWIGTGLILTLSVGVPHSRLLGESPERSAASGFSFVQIGDSHIGFSKPANPDVTGTLQLAVDKINALPGTPEFLIHTGDLTHLAKPAEFDSMDGVLQGLRAKDVFFVPGEHDITGDDGKLYLERYGKNVKGRGWYSFDHAGVHFIGLNNGVQLEGLGDLGTEQLAWLGRDLEGGAA